MSTTRDPDSSPDVLSGELLRALREETGLSQTRAAAAAGVSQPSVSRTELGAAIPGPDHVAAVLAVYATHEESTLTPARVDALVEQAREAADQNKDVRVHLQAGTAHHVQRAIKHTERDSTLVRSFHPSVVIGNLQARPLIENIFTPTGGMTADDAEKAIALRLQRAEVMREPGREWRLVQTEQALRWPVRDYAAHAAQLDHIADTVAALPNVTLRVIPLDTLAPATAPVTGFHIYDDHTVIIGTDSGPARITPSRDPKRPRKEALDQIAMYEAWHADLMELALPESGSVDLIRDLASWYRDRAGH